MTDEEIEFALKQYAIGGGRNVMNMDWAGTLDYINRLKEQIYQTDQKLAECENEIERMAKVLYGHYCGSDKCGQCKQPNCMDYIRAKHFANAGIGDKKQAVKEFAEKVKPIIDELVELMFNDYEPHCKVENCEKPDDIPCGCSICVEENKQLWESKIDNLITELYGADE